MFESLRSTRYHDFCFKNCGEITAYGLPTTAPILLNESGKWSPDAIERSLAHADTNAIRGTYNRGRYWDERVAMHQWWAVQQLAAERADIVIPDYASTLKEMAKQLGAVGGYLKGDVLP